MKGLKTAKNPAEIRKKQKKMKKIVEFFCVFGHLSLRRNKKQSEVINRRAELFKAGLREPRISANFEFRFESLKSIFSVIVFVYNMMIG